MVRASPKSFDESSGERGVALALVLAVLVCLLTVAIPFTLSMRHEQEGVAWRAADQEARREAGSVRDLALATLGGTAPDRDLTPWADAPQELAIDVAGRAEELGITDLGPRGRLLSARVEDPSGRIDLNRASLFMVARGLGLSTRLSNKLKPEDKEIRLEDGSFLEDQGFLWIEGELTYYKSRDGNVVRDYMRPALVPGFWDPVQMPKDAREFESGTEVVDFRAWMVAASLFKSEPGRETRFETLSQPFAIANFGFGALKPEQRSRLERLFTLWQSDGGRDRFGLGQRITAAISAGESSSIRLEGGQFIGRGTLCRITTNDGKVAYSFVVATHPQDDGLRVDLEMPLLVSADAYQAKAEFLVPRPVNVNSCTQEMLELLLRDLRVRGKPLAVDDEAATLVAQRIIAARPLTGLKDLLILLDRLVDKENALKPDQRDAIRMNAEHSGALWLETGTLPFCYAADGVFDVHVAASLNWQETGRERARAFLHELVAAPGPGTSRRIFATQRDFDEPWRITRQARGWTTQPENLNVFDGQWGLGAADPGSRLPAMVDPLNRMVSEDLNETGARLKPGRMDLTPLPNSNDVTIHFDEGRWVSKRVDGWSADDQAPLVFASEDGDEGIDMIADVEGVLRLQPFSVSMWWNPGKGLRDQVLFDTGDQTGFANRVRLHLIGRVLQFDVYDAFERNDENEFAARISYDFTDGLQLEPDTCYYVTAFTRGSRGDQMCLWIDGRPRGKWMHQSRTLATIDNVETTISIDTQRLPDASLLGFQSTQTGAGTPGSSAPAGGAAGTGLPVVLRMGGEVIEGYAQGKGGVIDASNSSGDPFGRRGARGTGGYTKTGTPTGATHPQGTSAQPYGYAALLATDVTEAQVSLADQLGKFGVAMLDSTSNDLNVPISIQATPRPLLVGTGLERPAKQTQTMELPLVALPNQKLETDNFQANGGYALLLSVRMGGGRSRQSDDNYDIAPNALSVNGHLVGEVELIYYTSYSAAGSGATLKGVSRGANLGSQFGKGAGAGGSNQNYWRDLGRDMQSQPSPYFQEHAFVIRPDPRVWGLLDKNQIFPVLVIPVGVRVADALGKTRTDFRFNNKQPFPNETLLRSEMLQIGIDFSTTSGGESTEWFRYEDIVPDGDGQPTSQGCNFVRDNRQAIEQIYDYLSGSSANDLSGNLSNAVGNSPSKLIQVGIGEVPTGFVKAIQTQQRFRAVCDSVDSPHPQGSVGLPVFRSWKMHGGAWDALPGRFDEVTVVGPLGLSDVYRAKVNYGYYDTGSEGIAEDWHASYTHFALTDPLPKTITRDAKIPWDQGEGPISKMVFDISFPSDSRSHPRMLKHPSGELPSFPPSRLHVGDFGTSDGAYIDELRILSFADANGVTGANWPTSSLRLEQPLKVGDESVMHVSVTSVQWPLKVFGTLNPLPPLFEVPQDACVFQVGDDFVISNGVDVSSDLEVHIAPDGRTRFGEPGHHDTTDPTHWLPFLVMSRLESGLSAREGLIEIRDAAGFPRRGCVLIDQEVLGYTDLQPGGAGAKLYVPTFLQEGSDRSSSGRGDAAFRGRYGTPVASHAADQVVFFWPWRYPDGYVERCDIPEMASLEVPIAARRAFFHQLNWKEQQTDPFAQLVASVRVQGRGDFAADPAVDPDFFVFEKSGSDQEPNLIDRQGDLLKVRFHVRYRSGALDTVEFTGNSWKRTPLLQVMGVEYVADRVVELHEETR